MTGFYERLQRVISKGIPPTLKGLGFKQHYNPERNREGALKALMGHRQYRKHVRMLRQMPPSAYPGYGGVK